MQCNFVMGDTSGASICFVVRDLIVLRIITTTQIIASTVMSCISYLLVDRLCFLHPHHTSSQYGFSGAHTHSKQTRVAYIGPTDSQ